MSHSRPSAIALRQTAFEDLGVLAAILDEGGWSASYRDAPTDDLGDPAIEAADLLIVLGGPIGVYECGAYPFLTQEIALLERRLGQDRPTLGICLGSQLMAAALGARVFAGPAKEIGWGRVALTDAGKASCLKPLNEDGASVLHWHGDTFDLPRAATRLASTALYENQAFAFGRNALALQFHVEVEPRALERWFVGHAVELSAAGISVPQLRDATRAVAGRLGDQARSVFAGWLREKAEPVPSTDAASAGVAL
jgi:GMP synthase (glutamine-hydrolysing)